MCVTSDYMLYRKLWAWKDHGKSYEWATAKNQGEYRWCHTQVGTNARMTEMQAAIGRVQLPKVRGWVTRRRELAERLYDRLKDARGLRVSPITPGEACYRFYAFISDRLHEHWTYGRVLSELVRRGVQCGQGACPEVYREQAFYTGLKFCPQARELATSSIMFKLDHLMTERTIDQIARQVKEVMRRACSVWV